jgi:D-sedoheptulose 7-phosphate isomerase
MSDAADVTRERIRETIALRQVLLDSEIPDTIQTVADAIVRSLSAGGTIFFVGNGGSSTDAGHLAAELLGRYRYDRQPLRSVALADHTAAMTAIGNDYGYDLTFSRQLRGLGQAGDVVVGLSTSGNSRNVVRALEAARELGIISVAFTGEGGGALGTVADHLVAVPSRETARIQECHMLLGHTLCEIVEATLCPVDDAAGGDAVLDVLP